MGTEQSAQGPGQPTLLTPAAATRALWDSRYLIVAATIVCAVVAVGVASFRPPRFQSRATLVLMPPPFKEAEKQDEMSSLIPKVLGVRDYAALLRSDDVLMEVIAQIRVSASGARQDASAAAAGSVPPQGSLEAPAIPVSDWTKGELEELARPSVLARCMTLTTEVTEKTAYGTTYSPVIVLTAEADTPEHARDLAQTWAKVAEKRAADLERKGNTGLEDFVNKSLGEAQKQLETLNAAIRDLEIEWDEELERARLTQTHSRLLTYEAKHEDLQMQMGALEKKIEALQTTLTTEPEKKELWKSPPMTAVFLEKSMGVEGLDSPQRAVGYREEILNETYLQAREQLLSAETELTGLRETDRRVVADMERLQEEVDGRREEIAARAFQRKQLDMQLTPFQGSYALLAAKLEQAKIAGSEQEDLANLKIVSNAVAPDRRMSSGRAAVGAAAIVLGACLSSAIVVLRALLALVIPESKNGPSESA